MSQNLLLKIGAICLLLGILVGVFIVTLEIFDDDTNSGDTSSSVSRTTSSSAFIPLLVIIIIFSGKKRKKLIILKKLKKSKIRKSKGEKSEMLELAKKFIDKDCIIYHFDGSQSQYGTIKEVTDNAILVEEKGELIAINLEFVSKIKEFPKNKNGKRNSVVF